MAATNEGHIHWTGALDETVTYLNQVIQLINDPQNPVKGALGIRLSGSQVTPLVLPNSTNAAPRWDAIPGTNPVLEARQDGHYDMGYIRIRQQ